MCLRHDGMRYPRRSIALLVCLIAGASACGGTDAPLADAGAFGACASVVFLNGHEYAGRYAEVRPVPGEVVGDARIPGCDDTGMPTTPPDEHVSVARLPGVDPEVAVVDLANPQTIYVRSDLDLLPEAVTRFFTAPSCAAEDSPIELEGQWLSIIGPGETTEVDLVPPYGVGMLVAESSAPRYLDAEIIIDVPPALGSPLSHEDVESSLWEGGTLRVRSTCHGERFVAERIEALPP